MVIVYPKTTYRTTGAGAIVLSTVIQKFDTFDGFRERFTVFILDNILELYIIKKMPAWHFICFQDIRPSSVVQRTGFFDRPFWNSNDPQTVVCA
jgi:hypothetical protein